MLSSLIKITIFIAVIAAATFGLIALMQVEGGVRIVLGASEINLTPLTTVVGLVLLVVVIWVGLKLLGLLVAVLKFINGDETAISRYFDRKRQEKGFKALTEGMLALASGEGEKAIAKARKAEKLLRKPELTNLLTAQAAEVSGDRKQAEKVYKQLLRQPETRFVGVRGLLKQKLSEGDTETALKLAQTAFSIRPSNEDVQDTLLQLQTAKADWEGARETLGAKLKHGSLPRDVHKRRDAVLALSEAKGVIAEGATVRARQAAIEANRLSPDLVPAAVMAARGYMEEGKPRYATRVLKTAWEMTPHPDLARAYAEIEPDETPKQRMHRFQALFKMHPDARETKVLEAELLIAAEDFPGARRALGNLVNDDPDARVLTIMAAIERGEGASDAVVKGWLARALSAPRGPQWVCDKCHAIHSEWGPTCANCGAFDTLTWTRPPKSDVAMPTGVEMLPLIVGPAEAPEEAEPVADPVEEISDAPEVLEAEIVEAEPSKEEAK